MTPTPRLSPRRAAAARWHGLSANLRAMIYMMGAVAALSAMVGLIKHLVTDLPFSVVVLFRMAFAALAMAPWLLRERWDGLKTARLGTHFMRAVLGVTGFLCFVYALGELLMADAVVLSFTMPLWSIILSGLFLGEGFRTGRVAATIIGFIGVVLIIKPQGGIAPAALFALASAMLGAAALITMKRLTSTEPAPRIVFYFFFFGTLISLGPSIYQWVTPSAAQFGWLMLAGLFGVIGQQWLTQAFHEGEVSAVMPLDYLRIPFAALIGFIWFSEIPDLWSAAGTIVIIASSLYVARSESRRRGKPSAS